MWWRESWITLIVAAIAALLYVRKLAKLVARRELLRKELAAAARDAAAASEERE